MTRCISGVLCIAIAGVAMPSCGDDKSDQPAASDELASSSDLGVEGEKSAHAGSGGQSNRDPSCPLRAQASAPLPGVKPEHLTLEYWLQVLGKEHDLDRVLLGPAQIEKHNAAIGQPREGYFAQRDLLAPLDIAEWTRKVTERRVWARDSLREGKYLTADGQPVAASELTIFDREIPLDAVQPQLRVALESIPIRCSPRPESFYSKSLDLRFDRNACSTVRAQEVVQLIAEWPNGMWLAGTRYSFGWIAGDAALSPAVPDSLHDAFVSAPRRQLLRDLTVAIGHKSRRGKRSEAATERSGLAGGQSRGDGETITVARGTVLPPAKKNAVYVASANGFHKSRTLSKRRARSTERRLTRRAILHELWRHMDTPFGLGGVNGGRDCSRILLDIFETFDLDLPRHSKWQSIAGTFWIDIAETLPESERLLLIDAAASKGIVLLHFPGHIMFYLGRNREGEAMVYHAFAEYLEPCEGKNPDGTPAETLVQVKGATVSNLELGRHTSRKSFLERLTRITVFGKSPGIELMGVAKMRPAAPVDPPRRCRDSRSAAIYFSPEQPRVDVPLRVIATTSRGVGPAQLTLVDPAGNRHTPRPVELGGPPYGRVVTLEQPMAGRWTAILGDGDDIVACDRVRVRTRVRELKEEDPAGPIWQPRRKWGVATENLYSIFIERLLDYSIAEDRVWPNLHTLTRDRSRNILYNHRGLDEDEQLVLQPDCADLPYALRAYFAWKMRLPFGYRRCKRARDGNPPDCAQPGGDDNLMSRLELGPNKVPQMKERGDLEAFDLFLRGRVLRTVHSSSGRTLGEDEYSDLYPVRLTRKDLRPGTVFVDPYGHVLTIADWIPQGIGSDYGILVGVDAQPDGTVGRRRFWRGSFLFHPDTEAGAAGFKAFRPRQFIAEPIEPGDRDSQQNEAQRKVAQALAQAELAHNGASGDSAPVTVPTGGSPGAGSPADRVLDGPVTEVEAADPVTGAGADAMAGAGADAMAGAGADAMAGAVPADPISADATPVEQVSSDEDSIARVGYALEFDNETLLRSRKFARFSLQQYSGTKDDFYETLERLINPRPLDPAAMQGALIDALDEAVKRRITSVDNGEKYMAEQNYQPMDMPRGARIFLASEPWESFSTPSRDLRLLISIDSVVGFADIVARTPRRFGLKSGPRLDQMVDRVRTALEQGLKQRTFTYTRSDGSQQTLSLADLVARQEGFEMAYNPNDCPEVRWAAPAGSAEISTCSRSAPAEQRARMERYRSWFATRKRPPN
ncbi:MAG: C40 family peptidase [Proteobacteria bacterium]|nr:C40 family peptidase [Pseudomonadota bacterium]